MNAPLPPDFAWHPYVSGQGLFVGILAVALVYPGDEGQWTLETNPSWSNRRLQLFSTEEEARRAANAWARKWESTLRDQCAWYNGRRGG